jgi:tagatose-1,6-bisphosphate aldolase non-catalytic subunit AgaZ/GatZ
MIKRISELIRSLIQMREDGRSRKTLLAVCPNSEAVLEAAIRAAAKNNTPMLFAATLNQVDVDGGYTGWTQAEFVSKIERYADRYHWDGPLYPCLDHGGPWLKDLHTIDDLSFDETMEAVKRSITACLENGYRLLHIDPTVDRMLSPGQLIPNEFVVSRTIELITYAERERNRLGIMPVDYEVGSEEVHGGLVAFQRFEVFLKSLRRGLNENGLSHAWPCFIVAQVGTDLHTTAFNSDVAKRLYDIVAPMGTLVKGHYTDWVDNPEDYTVAGVGGANVGPEFTAEEYLALRDMSKKEKGILQTRSGLEPSNIMLELKNEILGSNRWKKWLQPDEKGSSFDELTDNRQDWLLQTGARYVWAKPKVLEARQKLYANIGLVMQDPHEYVLRRIESVIDKYINAFNLFDSITWFGMRD